MAEDNEPFNTLINKAYQLVSAECTHTTTPYSAYNKVTTVVSFSRFKESGKVEYLS